MCMEHGEEEGWGGLFRKRRSRVSWMLIMLPFYLSFPNSSHIHFFIWWLSWIPLMSRVLLSFDCFGPQPWQVKTYLRLLGFLTSKFSGGGSLATKSRPTFCHPWMKPNRFLYMGFPRQEYWSGLPLPSPRQSSRPRDRTIEDGFLHYGKMLYYWATREAPKLSASSHILFCQGLTWIRPSWIVMGYWWELNPCWLVSWQGDQDLWGT